MSDESIDAIKCGEIYVLPDGKYVLRCDISHNLFITIDDFHAHRMQPIPVAQNEIDEAIPTVKLEGHTDESCTSTERHAITPYDAATEWMNTEPISSRPNIPVESIDPPTDRKSKLLKCQFCYKTLPCRSKLNIHENTHTREHTYVCTHCPKVYRSKGNLIAHIKSVHKQLTLKCPVCAAIFLHKTRLSTHIIKAHPSNPLACYPCEQCDDKFKTIRQRNDHLSRTHNRTCNYCRRPFSDRRDIAKYMRAHCQNGFGCMNVSMPT